MKLLLAGATGLVGSQVLALALSDARITTVVAPVRRDLATHPKLAAPRVDFEQLPEDANWWGAGAFICALGTTLRAAGSREAFQRVDHGYPLDMARIARRHGTPTCVLTSAMGADPASRFFYNRVKGELERDLAHIGFPSLTFVRPGMIDGERRQFRAGERAMGAVLRAAAPILPRRLRPSPAANIAAALIAAAVAAVAGVHVVSSADLA